MGEYGREQRNQLSRAIAYNGGGRQLKGIVDNRPLNILQTSLIGAIQEKKSDVIQLVPAQNIKIQTGKHYQVEYTGLGNTFAGGAQAGNRGITGVQNYRAFITHHPAGAAPVTYQSRTINWADREYQRGHILSAAMGGGSTADNIFKQDGGQNTTGDWPSFEINSKNLCLNNPGDNFSYTIDMTGQSLNYNQPL